MNAHLHSLMDELVADGIVPGIVIAVRQSGTSFTYASGEAAPGQSMTPDTIVPVASITKLATALAILRLVASGHIQIDDPLSRHLPDAAAARDGVTLRRLLCHTSGLPDDLDSERAPYTAALDWPALARACLGTPLQSEPGGYLRYSNVGPGLLAIVVERITSQPFPTALDGLVFAPLGIDAWIGCEPPRPPAIITGSLGEHAGTEIEPFNSTFWRRLALPWGGLLTTAEHAITLVRAFTDGRAEFLPAGLLTEATTDQAGGVPGEMAGLATWPCAFWGLGPEILGDKPTPFLPPSASPRSFGHGGVSGSLAWHDPDADISWAMLSNRTADHWWQHWSAIGDAIMTHS